MTPRIRLRMPARACHDLVPGTAVNGMVFSAVVRPTGRLEEAPSGRHDFDPPRRPTPIRTSGRPTIILGFSRACHNAIGNRRPRDDPMPHNPAGRLWAFGPG